jgi:hypothetical protein
MATGPMCGPLVVFWISSAFRSSQGRALPHSPLAGIHDMSGNTFPKRVA